MGKDQESIDQSRAIRSHLLTQWGRIPTSIWKANWSVKVTDLSKSYLDFQKEQAEKHGKLYKDNPALQLSSAGHGKEGGLSRFPQDLCQFLVKFLTPEKLETAGYFNNYLPTVIDPFAGHNSRGESTWLCNRNYVGWDCCIEHDRLNKEVLARLESKAMLMKPEAKIEFVLGDSRDINYNEEFDFSITSPPFYDLEYYGEESEQLGRAKTYNDFIYMLTKVYENVYRALKPNTYCVVETNDFRRNGEFHTYHADMISILKRVGFVMHDMIVCDYGTGFLEAFLSDIEANKIVSKEHSYFAVAKKLPKRTETRQETRERLLIEVQDKTQVESSIQQVKML